MVLKNDVPCKALKLLSDSKHLMIGLENGLVRVIDRNTFQIVAESKLLDSPILKIEQVMQAIVI